MYGTTRGGGINNYGVIFKIKNDGSGYSKLVDFSGTSDGINPFGSLYSDGTFIYGMTLLGGINNNLGTIYKYQDIGMGIVENNSSINFSIYPNPVSNNLQISVSDLNFKEGQLEIFDVRGSSIQKMRLNDLKSNIDVSDLTSGIYFITLHCSKGTVSKTFIKD